MKRYPRIVVQLAGVILLMAASAPAQNLYELDESWSGTVTVVNEFISHNGILSTNPTVFASGMYNPMALTFNSTGDLYVANGGNSSIYIFTNSTNGLSTTPTFFASGVKGACLAFDSAGNLFVSDSDNSNVYEFVKHNGVLSSTPTLFASGLDWPVGLAFDGAGNLFVAESGTEINSGVIYKFAYTNGAVSTTPTVFATGLMPWALAFDSDGNLFETDMGNGGIKEFINNAGVLSSTPAAFAGGFIEPVALAFDGDGNLFEADYAGGDGIGTINKFANTIGGLRHHADVFADKMVGPIALAFAPSPTPRGGRLTVTKFQAKVSLNPAKTNADSCSFTAVPAVRPGFSASNQVVTVDVGDLQATFTLDAKGTCKSSTNSCKFSYAKKTGVWTVTASMKKGTWATAWGDYGVTNITTPKAGLTLAMPVTVTIGTNTYTTQKSLLYKATAGKSGALK